jgi:hypothetical protein
MRWRASLPRASAPRIACAAFALAVSLAAQAAPLGYDEARHLLNRAGFGAEPREIVEYAKLERA